MLTERNIGNERDYTESQTVHMYNAQFDWLFIWERVKKSNSTDVDNDFLKK